MPVLGEVKESLELLDKLGLLEKCVLKLVNNPDKAALRLTVALSELARGYTALHDELVELCTLSFSEDETGETRKRLIRLQGGRLSAEVESMAGSCTKIRNSYERYLTGWFSRVLDGAEALDLEKLFFDFGNMDGSFVQAAHALSATAQQYASNLLVLLHEGRNAEAQEAVYDFARDVAPIVAKLSGNLRKLWECQNRFVKAAGVV